jgi:peptidoglycan/xylan/chitin deacetylase (PgdA/CDA1 family)
MIRSTQLFRGIPNKREYLARALGRLGALNLLERAVATRRPALVVLTYHRIAEPGADSFYDPVVSATPKSFRAQVTWLRNHIRIVTLKELESMIRSGARWREPAAFLTFDDGYRDNFDVAVPILREWSVPATFFIPTDFLESPKLPWWDHVAYVIKQSRVQRLNLKRSPIGLGPALSIDLDSVPRFRAITTIIRTILDGTIADVPWFLEQLAVQADVAVDQAGLSRALFMNWEQVRNLADSSAGLTVGSHGHSHQALARLDEESQCRELAFSKQILENRLGHEVPALAYPYGWAGTYTLTTKRAAAKTGYRLAFASRDGVNRLGVLDPFEISRLGVSSGDSPSLLRARAALHSAFGRSFL